MSRKRSLGVIGLQLLCGRTSLCALAVQGIRRNMRHLKELSKNRFRREVMTMNISMTKQRIGKLPPPTGSASAPSSRTICF